MDAPTHKPLPTPRLPLDSLIPPPHSSPIPLPSSTLTVGPVASSPSPHPSHRSLSATSLYAWFRRDRVSRPHVIQWCSRNTQQAIIWYFFRSLERVVWEGAVPVKGRRGRITRTIKSEAWAHQSAHDRGQTGRQMGGLAVYVLGRRYTALSTRRVEKRRVTERVAGISCLIRWNGIVQSHSAISSRRGATHFFPECSHRLAEPAWPVGRIDRFSVRFCNIMDGATGILHSLSSALVNHRSGGASVCIPLT